MMQRTNWMKMKSWLGVQVFLPAATEAVRRQNWPLTFSVSLHNKTEKNEASGKTLGGFRIMRRLPTCAHFVVEHKSPAKHTTEDPATLLLDDLHT